MDSLDAETRYSSVYSWSSDWLCRPGWPALWTLWVGMFPSLCPLAPALSQRLSHTTSSLYTMSVWIHPLSHGHHQSLLVCCLGTLFPSLCLLPQLCRLLLSLLLIAAKWLSSDNLLLNCWWSYCLYAYGSIIAPLRDNSKLICCWVVLWSFKMISCGSLDCNYSCNKRPGANSVHREPYFFA